MIDSFPIIIMSRNRWSTVYQHFSNEGSKFRCKVAIKDFQDCDQRWKSGYLALGCQFQFRCVEIRRSDFSLGLVSQLLKNRLQFRFLGFSFGLSFIQES